MVYKFAHIAIQDSSTAKTFKIYHVYDRHKAIPGVVVFGVVKRELYRKRFFKKKKLFALIMTVNTNVFRFAGSYYCKFDSTSGMLMSENRENFYALKLYCPIAIELRQSSHKDLCQYSRKTY